MAKELEIKILDIDVNKVKEKLKNLGAKYIGEGIQDMCTYDLLPLISVYEGMLSGMDYVPDKHVIRNKWLMIARDIDYVLDEEGQTHLESLTNYSSFTAYVKELFKLNALSKLDNEKIKELIKKYQHKLTRWVRLRSTNNKVELTVKQIFSEEEEYNIDEVEEYEITVSDYETANIILENLGFVPTNRQQKYRISYVRDGVKIELDRWPLLNFYLEIEGSNEDDIYKLVKLLGYKKEDTKIMNAASVYFLKGVDVFKYENLSFDLEGKKYFGD